MRSYKIDCFAADFHFNADHPSSFRFPPVLILAMIDSADRKPREDRHTVLPTLVVEIVREGIAHFSHLRQFGDLILAFGALHTSIDFLQADEIGMFAINYVCDTLQVKFLIHAYANMDVVSHHSESFPGAREC